jgi:hypothetical protein
MTMSDNECRAVAEDRPAATQDFLGSALLAENPEDAIELCLQLLLQRLELPQGVLRPHFLAWGQLATRDPRSDAALNRLDRSDPCLRAYATDSRRSQNAWNSRGSRCGRMSSPSATPTIDSAPTTTERTATSNRRFTISDSLLRRKTPSVSVIEAAREVSLCGL